MVRGADPDVITIDTNSLATLTWTTCSTECPSRDATVDIFPEPATCDVCEEALDIDAISVAAPTTATCSMGDLAHGSNDYNPMAFPVMRLFSAPELGPPAFSHSLQFWIVPMPMRSPHTSCSMKLESLAAAQCRGVRTPTVQHHAFTTILRRPPS